jgi:SAM-dependent methyltransferase
VPPPVAQECPAPQPAPPAELDEQTLVEKSKALFDAIDNNDATTFMRMVGPSFVLFEEARSYSAPMLVSQMAGRLERGTKKTRQWKDVRAELGPNAAVFTGDAIEQVPGEAGATSTWEGWNTIVWVFDGTDWRAAHAQWQPGGVDAERSMWNEAFRKGGAFKTTPNQLLVDTVKTIKTRGTALDVSMGQGRNAVFLATKGWKVTGIDLSDEAIRQANAAAAKAHTKLTTVQADTDSYDFGVAKYDLVTMIYAGSDGALVDKLAAAVKPNGYLIVEYFASESTAGSGIGGFAAGELAAKLAGWKITRDEIVDDLADWGLRKQSLVRFVAQKTAPAPAAKTVPAAKTAPKAPAVPADPMKP